MPIAHEREQHVTSGMVNYHYQESHNNNILNCFKNIMALSLLNRCRKAAFQALLHADLRGTWAIVTQTS